MPPIADAPGDVDRGPPADAIRGCLPDPDEIAQHTRGRSLHGPEGGRSADSKEVAPRARKRSIHKPERGRSTDPEKVDRPTPPGSLPSTRVIDRQSFAAEDVRSERPASV